MSTNKQPESVPEGARHTPGPWSVIRCYSVRMIHHDPETAHESTMLARVETRRNADEAEANARLIASAPDLLEALQACKAVAMDALGNTQTARVELLKDIVW